MDNLWYLTALILITVLIATWFFFKKVSPDANLDVNKDNKLDVNDIKFVADVNKDGKVDVADAKAAVIEVVAEVKEAVVEAPKPAEKPKKAPAKRAATPRKTTKKASK